jgi:hypothetical protein
VESLCRHGTASAESLPARHGRAPIPFFLPAIAGNFTLRQFAVCRHASLGGTPNAGQSAAQRMNKNAHVTLLITCRSELGFRRKFT